MNVAVGGTNGWFPDGPEKPWLDQSASTLLLFYFVLLDFMLIILLGSCHVRFLGVQKFMAADLVSRRPNQALDGRVRISTPT